MNNSEKIKVIFLDIGGVILNNGWDRTMRSKAAEKFGLDYDELNERHHLTFDTYEVGKLSLNEYLKRVVFYESRPFSMDEFQEYIFRQSKEIPEMISLVSKLKSAYSLRIAAISNEGREITEYRIQKFKLDRLIDFFISSCFVHFRKPDVDIYRIAMDIAQVRPEQAVYIDDRPMFVDVASDLGIRGIAHTSLDETRDALEDFGLLL
ncbi:MAG: HAD family hydrolase [Anaerolineales bacterium]|jgi:putative hydrolase of the HAD superfamily